MLEDDIRCAHAGSCVMAPELCRWARSSRTFQVMARHALMSGRTIATRRLRAANHAAMTRTRTLLPVPVGALKISMPPAVSVSASAGDTVSVVCSTLKSCPRVRCR